MTDKPDNAPQRKIKLKLSLYAFTYFILDCPGTSSESAGKSEACAGCPNQQICATAPKGPDPGIFLSQKEFNF